MNQAKKQPVMAFAKSVWHETAVCSAAMKTVLKKCSICTKNCSTKMRHLGHWQALFAVKFASSLCILDDLFCAIIWRAELAYLTTNCTRVLASVGGICFSTTSVFCQRRTHACSTKCSFYLWYCGAYIYIKIRVHRLKCNLRPHYAGTRLSPQTNISLFNFVSREIII